ncbi:caspase-2-like isoform X1 [Penaeus japonicus]|uniref:caspase-2-like isoform X1 n=1 Tax=Penaeus japonicus TaxID=27405 RepID=UPI001C710C08|nr:caspase-2-like isoform X1 [Penaeus japonicus]
MATLDVKTALRKGMFVERNVAGSYQCACGEELKKASLSGHLKSKKHLEEFTVQTALEKNIFQQKENETYQCACGRRLKKASLKVHLTTMVHLAEVHARKLWIKPGENTEPDDVNVTSTDDEEDEDVLDLDGQFKRCSYCKERFPNDESLAKHMKDQKHELYINRNQESLHTTNDSKQQIPPYTVKSDPRGHVYVFNNDFKGSASLRERRGAKVDSQNLKRTFTKMGYKVFLMENLGAERMKEEVAKIRDDPSLAFVDALVMVILSHGKRPYKCQAQDGATLDIREIRRNFTPSMCPNFKDKPKIFLMNYCRGKERQTVQTDGIEATRDMATIYATQHGVSALRNRREGTHFVKALCSVLRKYAASDTLRTIYLKLEKEMKQNKGTTPQWEDDAFRDFYFMPTVASAGM